MMVSVKSGALCSCQCQRKKLLQKQPAHLNQQLKFMLQGLVVDSDAVCFLIMLPKLHMCRRKLAHRCKLSGHVPKICSTIFIAPPAIITFVPPLIEIKN